MKVYNDCAFTGGRMLGEAWRAFCRCHLCGAQGPEENRSDGNKAEEAARAAALRRYTPQLKPLPLEKVLGTEVELEIYGCSKLTRIKSPWHLGDVMQVTITSSFIEGDDRRYLSKNQYGKTWRCWERKPTKEEMEAAKWET